MSDETTTKRRAALHLAFVNGTADRIERERQRLAARTEAEKWVEEILPELVRKAAADGDTWVHIDRNYTTNTHRASARAATLRELGLEPRGVSRATHDVNTGLHNGWEYDWVLDLHELKRVRTL